MIYFLNVNSEESLPRSDSTVREWVVRRYQQERAKVQQAMQSSQSKIHFTVDLWTSPNTKALMGLVAHYIGENGGLRQSVVSLRELNGQHTGDNQAQLIYTVLEEYGILSKVGYFMMDNASNNDTMMLSLSNR